MRFPFFVVLDNYQTVPAASHLHAIVAEGLDVMPMGITMAIISRHEPPPLFARFNAAKKMALIGWNDVRFTFEETADVVNAGMPQPPSREAVLELHQKADGWVAAVVLMLETRLHGAETVFPSEVAAGERFDYFANEILNKMDPETREFLLKTALLPAISVPIVAAVTGSSGAGRILAALNRQNYFTQRLSGSSQDYRYRPLFRACLMARARSGIDPAELAHILGKAAGKLAEFGRTDDAVSLLVEIGDWSGLAQLLVDRAKSFILEGRNETLEGYLRKLPERTMASAPRLLYWLGLCRMPFDVEESRTLLERAFRSFNEVHGRLRPERLRWTRS